MERMNRAVCDNPLCIRSQGCALAQLVEGQLSVPSERVGDKINEDGFLTESAVRMIDGQVAMLQGFQENPRDPLNCIYTPEQRYLAFTRIVRLLQILEG